MISPLPSGQESLGDRPEYGLLARVPGIGRILAAIILLETGPIERFAAVGNYALVLERPRSLARMQNGSRSSRF